MHLSYARIHHWLGANLVLTGHSPLLSMATTPTPYWALHCTKSLANSSHLADAIWSLTALGLSDGSYIMPHCYPNLATTAWFLANSQADLDSLFFRALPVGGLPTNINAYPAELQGIHDLLVAVEFFATNMVCQRRNYGGLQQSWHPYPVTMVHQTCSLCECTCRPDPCNHHPSTLIQNQTLFIYIPGHQDALEHF